MLRDSAAPRSDRPQPALRPAVASDDSFLRQLYRSTRDDLVGIAGIAKAQIDDLIDFQFRAQRDSYTAEFPNATHDIVLLDGVPAGRLYVDHSRSVHRLVDIALLPEYQGRGIGTALIRGAQKTACEDSARVRLHVRPGSAAEALYRRLGFAPIPADGESEVGGGVAEGVSLEMEWRPEYWLPIHVVPHTDGPLFEWFDAGDTRLTDPFFVQVFQRAEHRNGSLTDKPWRRRGSLAELLTEAERAPGLSPSGFVFHMSRCGSTLLSQMLAADPDNLVLSEPPAVDQVLRMWWNSSLGVEDRMAALRGVVSALGRPRHGERRLFIKLDAWHATMLPVLLDAFPGTPWVFLHRDPVEVLASLERSTPAFIIPGAVPARAFGLELADAVCMSPDEYTVAVVAAICRAALSALGRAGKLVDYENLPGALGAVLAHFNVVPDPERVTEMEAARMWDAKAPTRQFVPDGPAKQARASEAMRSASGLITAALASRREMAGGQELAEARGGH